MDAAEANQARRRSLPASMFRRRAHTRAPRVPLCAEEYCIRRAWCPSRFDHGSRAGMEPVGRMFLCGRCRAQVVLCSRCDRGNVYCGVACAGLRRRESVRAAGSRYQHSRRGRLAHAARMQRYRERCRKVTHHGSDTRGANALLDSVAVMSPSPQPLPTAATIAVTLALVLPPRCSRCGAPRAGAVRQGWLRHHRRSAGPPTGAERSRRADDYP